MTTQIRDWLYIGKFRDTMDLEGLRSHNIQAMLQLAEHVPQPGIESLFLPVDDGESIADEHIEQGIAFINKQREHDKRILVACGVGISRRATFCVAALHEAKGLSLLDAYRSLHESYPLAMPHMALWQSVLRYYGEDISLVDAARQVSDSVNSHNAP